MNNKQLNDIANFDVINDIFTYVGNVDKEDLSIEPIAKIKRGRPKKKISKSFWFVFVRTRC